MIENCRETWGADVGEADEPRESLRAILDDESLSPKRVYSERLETVPTARYACRDWGENPLTNLRGPPRQNLRKLEANRAGPTSESSDEYSVWVDVENLAGH
jgi:hypothetical protein